MILNQAGRQRFTVQDCTYRQGLLAVQMASQFESWEALRSELEEALPFNSAQTRRRYVSQLFRWALDGGNLRSIGVCVWHSYREEEVVNHILRDRYLTANPVLGRFVSNTLTNIPPGTELDVDSLERHLVAEQVSALDTSLGKLKLTMRDMGFVRKVDREYVVIETFLPKTAFLILLHYNLAPEPTTIPMSQVIEHPFWRYLGGRREVEVRATLSQAAAGDFISRYATVDSLEQITTRFSLKELLQQQVRLDS